MVEGQFDIDDFFGAWSDGSDLGIVLGCRFGLEREGQIWQDSRARVFDPHAILFGHSELDFGWPAQIEFKFRLVDLDVHLRWLWSQGPLEVQGELVGFEDFDLEFERFRIVGCKGIEFPEDP